MIDRPVFSRSVCGPEALRMIPILCRDSTASCTSSSYLLSCSRRTLKIYKFGLCPDSNPAPSHSFLEGVTLCTIMQLVTVEQRGNNTSINAPCIMPQRTINIIFSTITTLLCEQYFSYLYTRSTYNTDWAFYHTMHRLAGFQAPKKATTFKF